MSLPLPSSTLIPGKHTTPTEAGHHFCLPAVCSRVSPGDKLRWEVPESANGNPKGRHVKGRWQESQTEEGVGSARLLSETL